MARQEMFLQSMCGSGNLPYSYLGILRTSYILCPKTVHLGILILKMKSALLAIALGGFMVAALPVDTSVALTSVEKRGLYGNTANELGLCRAVTIIFARGTSEPQVSLNWMWQNVCIDLRLIGETLACSPGLSSSTPSK